VLFLEIYIIYCYIQVSGMVCYEQQQYVLNFCNAGAVTPAFELTLHQ
jgi:hypothetical protein